VILIKIRQEWLPFPCPEERPVLIKQYRERAHQSASTVLKNLKLRYFWPKMDAEIAEIISKCPCFRGKSRVSTKASLKFSQLTGVSCSRLSYQVCADVSYPS